MTNEPEIKKILNKFPGVEIHSITEINETTEDENESSENKTIKEK